MRYQKEVKISGKYVLKYSDLMNIVFMFERISLSVFIIEVFRFEVISDLQIIQKAKSDHFTSKQKSSIVS